MSERWYRRALLASLVGLGVASGLARAQTQSTAPPLAGPTTTTSYKLFDSPPAGAPIPPGAAWGEPAIVADPGAPAHRHILHGGLVDWVHGHHCGCWAHHNCLGCGSCKSEGAFLFGGCRTFYGEPCLKGPPTSPIPPPYAQISPPISTAPGWAPANSGLAPYSNPPGLGLPPQTTFDFSAVPSGRLLPNAVAAPPPAVMGNYQFMPGGYR